MSFISKHDAYRFYSQDKKKAPTKKTKFFLKHRFNSNFQKNNGAYAFQSIVPYLKRVSKLCSLPPTHSNVLFGITNAFKHVVLNWSACSSREGQIKKQSYHNIRGHDIEIRRPTCITE